MKETSVIWLMGLSGSGKTTTAYRLQQQLMYSTIVLDTDELRPTVNKGLGWSEEDRMENVRRYAELAKVLSQQHPVIVCCATPLKSQRQLVREVVTTGLSIVHLYCPLSDCRVRSSQDYYNLLGIDPNVTSLAGVNFSWEPPLDADLTVNTALTPQDDVVSQIIDFLK